MCLSGPLCHCRLCIYLCVRVYMVLLLINELGRLVEDVSQHIKCTGPDDCRPIIPGLWKLRRAGGRVACVRAIVDSCTCLPK